MLQKEDRKGIIAWLRVPKDDGARINPLLCVFGMAAYNKDLVTANTNWAQFRLANQLQVMNQRGHLIDNSARATHTFLCLLADSKLGHPLHGVSSPLLAWGAANSHVLAHNRDVAIPGCVRTNPTRLCKEKFTSHDENAVLGGGAQSHYQEFGDADDEHNEEHEHSDRIVGE